MKDNPPSMAALFAIFASKPLKSIYNKLVPIGYEDERGFHYGQQ
jgi:hypothetical protein